MLANFNRDLDYANVTRKRLDAGFYPALSRDGHFVPLERSPGSIYIQRNCHVDCIVAALSGGSITVEEKIVRWPGYPYTAVTLETHSNLERTRTEPIGDGWMKTSIADFLLYAFQQVDYRLLVWLFDLPKLREWFMKNYEHYRFVDTPNDKFTTRCRVVPLSHIPKNVTKIMNKMI